MARLLSPGWEAGDLLKPEVANRPDPIPFKASSWGQSDKAKAYRQKQKELIEQANFGAAQQMDIQDIQQLFGSKYDDAIQQMIEYAINKGY